MSWPASRNRSMLWRPSLSSSLNLKWDARAEPPQTFHGSFRPVGHAGQDVVAGKLWILFEHLFHRHARREQVQDQRHPDPMPLMQGLPKQMLGFTEILFRSSLRSIYPDSVRDRSLEAIILAGVRSRRLAMRAPPYF